MIRATKALSCKLLAILKNKYSLMMCFINTYCACGLFFVQKSAVTNFKLLLRLFFAQLHELWQAKVLVLEPTF